MAHVWASHVAVVQSASLRQNPVAFDCLHTLLVHSVVVQSLEPRQSSPGPPMAQKKPSHRLLRQSSSVRQLLSRPPRPQVPRALQLRLSQSPLVTQAAPVNPAVHFWSTSQSPLKQSTSPSQS